MNPEELQLALHDDRAADKRTLERLSICRGMTFIVAAAAIMISPSFDRVIWVPPIVIAGTVMVILAIMSVIIVRRGKRRDRAESAIARLTAVCDTEDW